MAKKILRSQLVLNGIAPNLLLKDIEITAPFLFQGEIDISVGERDYIQKIIFYKKNLKLLKHLNLHDYFYLCLAGHWATAGTYVPTNVDNQIREGLWKHKDAPQFIDLMGKTTLHSWNWDFTPVTGRMILFQKTGKETVKRLSTHEGTWLSVAIGAYNALRKHRKMELAHEMAEAILIEIKKEQDLLLELREARDYIRFLKATALVAHNLGDLDRVIDQWGMNDHHDLKNKIYKLGHKINDHFHPILTFAGEVNKKFMAIENHRHMSLRQAKCLRSSASFLVPIGPFMDEWGVHLGSSDKLNQIDKAQIILSLFEGFKRQDLALGYIRAFSGMMTVHNLEDFAEHIPYDIMTEMKKSKFFHLSQISREEFEDSYRLALENFKSEGTEIKF